MCDLHCPLEYISVSLVLGSERTGHCDEPRYEPFFSLARDPAALLLHHRNVQEGSQYSCA